MTVGARLCAYVCKASRGHDGDERKMILYYWGKHIEWGKDDRTRPGVQPGLDVFARSGHSLFAPQARVSMSVFARLGLGSCMCALGDQGGCLIVLMG